jgi:hypothetical protein
MAGFFSKLAQNGFLGGAVGAYATNKKFRGGVNDFLFGTESEMNPYNQDSLSSLQELLQGGGLQGNDLYGSGQSYLQNLLNGSPQAFQNFEAPYLQNFQQNIAPGIAERFAGAGTGGGAMSSSGLNQALAQAGRSLQTDLAGLRSGLQMQALPQALNYAQQPIQNRLNAASQIPGQYYERPGQPGFLHTAGPAIASAAANYFAPGSGALFSGGGGGVQRAGGGGISPGGFGGQGGGIRGALPGFNSSLSYGRY